MHRGDTGARTVSSRPTILVVDDDESIRQLLEVALDEVGEVTTVPDGDTALEFTAQVVPDIVVIDVMMPGRDGLEVLTAWRAEQRTAEMNVIILSARDRPTDEEAGYRAGADAYVTKPMDVDVLRSLVEAMLAQQAMEKQQVLDEFRNLQVGDFPS